MFKRKSRKAAVESAPSPVARGKKASVPAPPPSAIEQAPELNGKKKKKNVKEIDGVLWLLDDHGNPLKKVRKKGKPDSNEEAAPAPAPSKPKKNVTEIDGQLYLLDADGNPSKKIRKKGEKMPRRKSMGRLEDEMLRGRASEAEGVEERRRAKSLGRENGEDHARDDDLATSPKTAQQPQQRREYIDEKGRKVIIEEDGSKTVIDKNGKRLRPKKKKVAPAPPLSPSPDDDSVFGGNGLNDHFLDAMPKAGSGRESAMFDKLWDEGASMRGGPRSTSLPTPSTNPANSSSHNNNHQNSSQRSATAGGGASNGVSDPANDTSHQDGEETRVSTSLSAKISELGKENRVLSLKLMSAEEEIQEMTEQNKREKAKNVKAMTEMMQLKADHTEASSELQKLRARVKDLSATLDAKDKQIETLRDKIANSSNNIEQHGGSPTHPKKGGWWGLEGSDPDLNGGASVGGDGAPKCPKCGAENKEVEELFAENRALQRKLEFERTSAQQDQKKKDERVVQMTKEIASLKDEIDLMLRGEKGDVASNPTYLRLVNERDTLKQQLEREKEGSGDQLENLKDKVESLETMNRDLKKQLGDDDGDEGSIDFITGLQRSPLNKNSKVLRTPTEKLKDRQRDLNKHIGEIQVNFHNSFNASNSKGWFGFGAKK